jgi:hypothetical protein
VRDRDDSVFLVIAAESAGEAPDVAPGPLRVQPVDQAKSASVVPGVRFRAV